ncbi:hypothetical protein [Ulvibacterium sp.]|uniref:hypothetical protein n=1 Tax=Ulvibacterium sp. TaxID=2665914 RepID=UPI003BAA2C6D
MRVFTEIQRFNQWWMQLIQIGLVLFLLYSFYQWYIIKEPTGNVAPTDTTLQLVLIFSILPILVLFYFLRLESTIDEIGVHYQFSPFHKSKKTIGWKDMEQCYVRKYSPLREYGGWGVRGSFGKNKAYNVKGNQGIQIELKKGGKMLVGTQRKTEAQQVIDRYFKKEQ